MNAMTHHKNYHGLLKDHWIGFFQGEIAERYIKTLLDQWNDEVQSRGAHEIFIDVNSTGTISTTLTRDSLI